MNPGRSHVRTAGASNRPARSPERTGSGRRKSRVRGGVREATHHEGASIPFVDDPAQTHRPLLAAGPVVVFEVLEVVFLRSPEKRQETVALQLLRETPLFCENRRILVADHPAVLSYRADEYFGSQDRDFALVEKADRFIAAAAHGEYDPDLPVWCAAHGLPFLCYADVLPNVCGSLGKANV